MVNEYCACFNSVSVSSPQPLPPCVCVWVVVWVHIPLSTMTRCSAPLPQHPGSCMATFSVHGNGANKRPHASSVCTPQLGLEYGNQKRRVTEQINRKSEEEPGRAGWSRTFEFFGNQLYLLPVLSQRAC